MSSLIKKINEINKNGESRLFLLFGGIERILTEQEIKNIWRLRLFCMFGGIDICLPENVNVNINAFCLFGGIDDKRKKVNADENALTLNIKGFCMFGGATIKDIEDEV